MAKRYLGYGYTNAQGVAKLEYDSEGNALTHSYTGVGAGKIDIVAESGSLQSETYAIIDATILDIGTSDNHNDIWYNQQNATLSRGSEYSEITENGGTAILRLKGDNSLPKTSLCIEFDIYQVDGLTSNNCISFCNTGASDYKGSYNLGNLNLSTGTWNHIKLIIDENNVVTPNEITSQQKTLNFTSNNMLFCFLTNGEMTKLRFKNWRAYPL